MSGQHARLSASAAHRWLQCPGSIKAAAGARDETSVYAAAGTLAHKIASDCWETRHMPVMFLHTEHEVDGHKLTVDSEMVDAVKLYLDALREDEKNGDQSWAELPLLLPLSKIDPDLGGTADYVRYRPSTKHLRVFDFKFGSGMYVEADSNEQMMLYALGAMLAVEQQVNEVEVTVVQPRFEGAAPVRSWSFPAVAILDFIADVREAAEKTRSPKPPLAPGDWCKFCKAARTCPELESRHHALVKAEFGKEGLPVDVKALAKALESIPLVKERIKALEEFAYKEAQKGLEIPGFKLVDKRPTRQWKSLADAEEWAKGQGIDPYAPRELLSPAQIEKKLAENAPRGQKKQVGKLLEPLVQKVSSGTALVPASDDRPPAKRVTELDFPVIEGTVKDVKSLF
jgi:hypothetical protein